NRDLAMAAIDSCRNPRTLFRDDGERSAVTFERGLVARVLLPAPHDTVGVLGIDFHEPGFPPASFASDQSRARSPEEIGHDIAGLAAVDESVLDKFDRFGGRVNPVCRGLFLFPESRL